MKKFRVFLKGGEHADVEAAQLECEKKFNSDARDWVIFWAARDSDDALIASFRPSQVIGWQELHNENT